MIGHRIKYKKQCNGTNDYKVLYWPQVSNDNVGDGNECTLCYASFSMFNRRHHCRQCNTLCCSKCSTNRKLIDNVMKRVCDTCYENEGDLCIEFTIDGLEMDEMYDIIVESKNKYNIYSMESMISSKTEYHMCSMYR